MAAVHGLEGILIVLLAVGVPIYWGRLSMRGRPPAALEAPQEPYADRPQVGVASPVRVVEVPIETVPSHMGPDRPTLYVAR